MIENRSGIAEVTINRDGSPVIRKQRLSMGYHYGIVVNVEHSRSRLPSLRNLVHIAARRQAGADVNVLVDARFGGKELNGALQESSVLPSGQGRLRHQASQLLRSLSVSGKVVFAAKQTVIDPRHIRHGCIEEGKLYGGVRRRTCSRSREFCTALRHRTLPFR